MKMLTQRLTPQQLRNRRENALAKRQAEAAAAVADEAFVKVKIETLNTLTDGSLFLVDEHKRLSAEKANLRGGVEYLFNLVQKLADECTELRGKLERSESGDPAVAKAWKREMMTKMAAVREEVVWFRERFGAQGPLAKRGVAPPQLRVISVAPIAAVNLKVGSDSVVKTVQFTVQVDVDADDADVVLNAVKDVAYFATVPASGKPAQSRATTVTLTKQNGETRTVDVIERPSR